MIISNSLSVGQITVILRVAIQILAYAGLALIGLIILGSAPRIASIRTHDMINRIMGALAGNLSSARWIVDRLRHKRTDNITASFLIIVFLSVSYAAFAAISDIGFLGFYACSVPKPAFSTFPASVASDDAARALIAAYMVNGSDPAAIKAFRCDATELVPTNRIPLSGCTAWRNSTWADARLFVDVNATDTDALMPRQLAYLEPDSSDPQPNYLNSFYVGPDAKRVKEPTVVNGLAVEPHESGLRVVVGVPQLERQQKVELPRTLALEVEVGCMTLGMYVRSDHLNISSFFATTGDWREYFGPDYLHSVLTEATDRTRAYSLPLYNTSSLDSNGLMTRINTSSDDKLSLIASANVRNFFVESSIYTPAPILHNCTQMLQRQLGLPITPDAQPDIHTPSPTHNMCEYIAIGGSDPQNGISRQARTKMICAAATQVNMVTATIETNDENKLSLNLTRLPSELNRLVVDYWPQPVTDTSVEFVPYERYTLSDNPNSPTTHFIPHRDPASQWQLPGRLVGPGSGGNVFSLIGHAMLGAIQNSAIDPGYAGIAMLDEGFSPVDMSPSAVTRWAGQVGASLAISSIGYNGWVARRSAPVQVVSVGGRVGSCYRPLYSLGFLPLVLSALVIYVWVLLLLLRSSLSGLTLLRSTYGGLGPYTTAVCPNAPAKDTLLVWEKAPNLHLQVVDLSEGDVMMGEGHSTALGYIKSEDTGKPEIY